MKVDSNKPITLAFGELLWDVLPSKEVLGGAPGNFAYRLSNLGFPAKVVSRIGNDLRGAKLSQILSERGLDLSLLQMDSKLPTGFVDVRLNENGEPDFTINRGVAYDQIELTEELEKVAASCKVLYFGTLVQRSNKSRETILKLIDMAKDATKFIDLNLRKDCFSAETVLSSLERTNILKLNKDEASAVSKLCGFDAPESKAFARKVISSFDIDICIITQGENGAYALNKKSEEVVAQGCTVKVVDTIGSGDGFSAGFVSGFLSGLSLNECCRIGNKIGAITATRTGGMPIITFDEIEDFESNNSTRSASIS